MSSAEALWGALVAGGPDVARAIGGVAGLPMAVVGAGECATGHTFNVVNDGEKPWGLMFICAPSWGLPGVAGVGDIVGPVWCPALVGGGGTWVDTCRGGGGCGNVGETVEATNGWEVLADTVVGTGLVGGGGVPTTCVGVVGLASITNDVCGG